MEREVQFLLDILQSAELITQYTSGCGKKEFIENLQLQDSVIRRLVIVAEAAKRISEKTRQSFPNIAWHEINGMRNRLVHEYDDINLDIVWNVVIDEIPTLIKELKLKVPAKD
jgi:uncharacterized protein with HEPN domain